MTARRSQAWTLAAIVGLGLPCGCAASAPAPRSLHYVDEALVYSPTVHHQAYAAYLRARLVMEVQPAAYAAAEAHLRAALKVAPRDPHLWTTLAELELRRGDRAAALSAGRTALTYRPGYPAARQLVARLEAEGEGGASAAVSRP
jgi:predicted Zn-dependent protease